MLGFHSVNPTPGSISLQTLTAAAAGANGADQVNRHHRGVAIIVDITAITGTTPTLTVFIEGKDEVSGKYYTLLASAALNAAGTTVLYVFPGSAVSANLSANAFLPGTWRIRSVIAGTTPAVTATIAAKLMP